MPRPIPAASRSLGILGRGMRRGTGKTLLERSAPPGATMYYAAIHPRPARRRGILAAPNKNGVIPIRGLDKVWCNMLEYK